MWMIYWPEKNKTKQLVTLKIYSSNVEFPCVTYKNNHSFGRVFGRLNLQKFIDKTFFLNVLSFSRILRNENSFKV